MSNTQPTTRVMMAAATVFVAVVVVGCNEVLRLDPSVRRVSLAEFAGPPASEATLPQVDEASEADQDSTEVLGNARVVPPTDSAQLQEATIDSPVDPNPFPDTDQRVAFAPMQPGDRVIVDSLVGEVNGRPIFADEFLALIEDRLLQEAKQTKGIQRVQAFESIIRRNLREWVRNELILADAEFALTEQEQQGLFAFMRSLK